MGLVIHCDNYDEDNEEDDDKMNPLKLKINTDGLQYICKKIPTVMHFPRMNIVLRDSNNYELEFSRTKFLLPLQKCHVLFGHR